MPKREYNPDLCDRLHNDNDEDHKRYDTSNSCLKKEQTTQKQEIKDMADWMKSIDEKYKVLDSRMYLFLAGVAITAIGSVASVIILLGKVKIGG